ncbi:MAG: hypothetical protein JWM59_3990 [Verrucomicrobiales bacterium]|nr:hypothetical protein [Verrucomicrobiales bacterium]
MNCWRYLPGAGLDEPVSENFRGLAALWDQLAGNGSLPFRHEFLPDLETLRQFQISFPDWIPIPQMISLQIKAADMLRERLQESGMADGPTWLEKLN